jgi:HD-GYP domain-containing protein (c-di-GMP phosphodiesterase class II)
MQLVPANEVREGQTVAQEVRDPHGRILLARGQRLTAGLIERLHKFGVQAVYLRDGFGEGTPEVVRTELRRQCQEVLSASFGNIAQEIAAKRLTLDAAAIKAATEELIEALLTNKNPLIALLDISSSSDRLLQHSVNATVLAITLAIDMRLPPDLLIPLATGMMFHDIGMTLLPDSLTGKAKRHTPDEVQALREHPRLGFEHLIRIDAVGSVAANIVLRHHEAIDGSGYPDGLGGDKVSILARIAAVAEVYDSLTSVRLAAPAVMPDVAIAYILSKAGKLFAKEVVIALCRRVALYPTGTAVLLNTGESGIVAGTSPLMPMRPLVTIYLDHRGRKLNTPLHVDLRRDPARFVLRSAANLTLLHQDKSPYERPKPVDPLYANLG